MKYGDKLFTKPEQCEQLKIELKRRMKNNNGAKRKRSEHTAPKKSQVKYDDGIGKSEYEQHVDKMDRAKNWRNNEV